MAERPLWRQAFDAVDRRVSGPVEAGVRTDAFADALALGLRVRDRLERTVERRTRGALHLFNLPAASDVKHLREQVAALQRDVRDLSREIEERG